MTSAKKIIADDVKTMFEPFEHFCKAMLDAYVVINELGEIIKTNQLFSQLVGKSTRQVLKTRDLDSFLKFFINDKPLTVADLLKHNQPIRIDEVRGENENHKDLNLIIGVYPFIDQGTQVHSGSFILIRDVTAEKNLHDIYKDTKIQSITDSLTGLFSRRYFEDWFETQYKSILSLPDPQSQEISVIMVDIDFFKKVNDVHGHQAGDYILKAVASTMRQTFRKTDLPCRYGGEEFTVILPGTGTKGAVAAAEKLRQAIAKEKHIFEGKEIPVTISCGVATLDPRENHNEAIARADAALYSSKHNGRNKVSFHDGKKINATTT
ncbi:MAG: diguanylate cyclase [Oligoflexales bacterium]